VTDTERKLDDQAATTPAELDEAALDQAAGGVTHNDFTFTKPVDKSSPTLHL
jgi:type VI protein secretion system component Hcp